MDNKPQTLYRGVKINYNNLPTFNFSGADLKINYEPFIDQYGRKTVQDGNEYGIYMSDNFNMVESSYGDLHHDGIPIHNNITIHHEIIMIPSVAAIYQINTNGLDIRKPFIADHLRGLYNNGFQGNEWITDIVPVNNYSLYRVRIGSDILHESEDIDLSKVENVSEQVRQKLEIRKYRLETFANAMEKMPSAKLRFIGSGELNILKSIYGENGLKYINEDSLTTSDVDGMLKYLVAKTFRQNEIDIDFYTIKYINGIKHQATSIDSIIEFLKNDKIKNMQSKVSFEERKKQEGVPYATSGFDKKENTIDMLISLIIFRQKKDNQHQQNPMDVIGPIQETIISEDQEWKMIKEKYNYDELESEKQQIIEEQFREMLNQKDANDDLPEVALKENDNIDNNEQFKR